MMIKPRVETVREKVDSRYTLVILAAKRARDLVSGKPALVEDDREKPVTIAANEIAEDLITYERVEEPEEGEFVYEEAAPEEACGTVSEEVSLPAEETPEEPEA